MYGPLVILGPPCSGKTTLASNLAAATERWHVSIGDLIRMARLNDESFAAATDAAFNGADVFRAEAIARLLSDAAEANERGLNEAVIDGGPPLDTVLRMLEVGSPLVLNIEVSEETQAKRFAARQPTRSRSDDRPSLFRSRCRLYAKQLPPLIRSFQRTGPVVSIAGDTSPSGMLRQALSAATLWYSLASAGQRPTYISLADGAYHASSSGIPDGARCPVLLIKPGIRFGDELVNVIDIRARAYGYRLDRMAVWPGFLVTERHAARAHFSQHYLLSRWASQLVNERNALGGHEYAAAFGRAALSAAWREEGPTPPVRVGPSWWQLSATAPDGNEYTLINGHIPRAVAEFEAPEAQTAALRLVPERPLYSAWKTLRESFLGHTRPELAAAGSLRSDAARGLLPLMGQVSFQANGFHLSAGPLDALRESLVWFGSDDPDTRLLGLAVDRPIQINGKTIWSSDATASHDIDTKLARLAMQLPLPSDP